MKQETVEEVAVNCWAAGAWDNRDDFVDGFIEGTIWKADRMYSEEEVINAFNEGQALNVRGKLIQGKEWFEQHKKK